LGINGFPFGMAAVQRQIQISKALINSENKVLVISQKGDHSSDRKNKEKIFASGSFEGVDYLYASGTPLYPENFIVRNVLKVVGAINEMLIILFYALTKKLTCVIVCTSNLARLKYFWYLTRITNTKLVYDYVEYFSSLENRAIKAPDNKKTFDTVFFKYADALIIISTYLEKHVNSMKANLPYAIVPPVMDFEKFSRINNKPVESDYFLYCGNYLYVDVIEFIIEAYRKTNCSSQGISLILVVNGPAEIVSEMKNSVNEDKTIKILSRLSYEDLIGYYKNAKALLIPLQDNLQDKARFPFKISEYTAAGRPIITSDSGAVIDYFEDGKNALIAKTGDNNDFATKLKFVLDYPQKADQIGRNGYELGLKYFNYKSYTSTLLDLISKQNSPDEQ